MALRKIMEHIKSVLATMVSNQGEHSDYVAFVRDVVSLIKSHGICPIDKFFYQISREYCPSLQDPRFDVAGIVAYGLRLAEGDNAAAQSLFYYLLNNFKRALMTNTLGNEVSVLKTVMRRSDHVLGYILGRLLPSIVMASRMVLEAYPLLDVYSAALTNLLAGSVVPRQLDEAMLPQVQALLSAAVEYLAGFGAPSNHPGRGDLERMHSIRQVLAIVNLLSPSIRTHALVHPHAAALDEAVVALGDVVNLAAALRGQLMEIFTDNVPGARAAYEHVVSRGRKGIFQPEQQTSSFARDIADDIRKHWVFGGGRITVPALKNPAGGMEHQPSMQGTAVADLEMGKCARGLFYEMEQIGEDNSWVRQEDDEVEPLEWRVRVTRPRSAVQELMI
jgi:hypothetical protein